MSGEYTFCIANEAKHSPVYYLCSDAAHSTVFVSLIATSCEIRKYNCWEHQVTNFFQNYHVLDCKPLHSSKYVTRNQMVIKISLRREGKEWRVWWIIREQI